MRLGLRFIALGYLAALIMLPIGLVLVRTFEPGLEAVWASVTTPAAIAAFWLTILVAAITVPLCVAFGVLVALVLVRGTFRGRAVLDLIVDLPFAISPVVVGLALLLLYGRGGPLADLGFDVLFSIPGIVLATVIVCIPFVVREVAPVLREIGTEQEEAAATLGASPWQTFRRVTIPALRWGIAYGVVLTTARALGEFGAVSVVSGKVAGETLTLTLLVEQRFTNFDLAGAYAASAVLALIAVATLTAMTFLQRTKEPAT